MHLCGLLQLTAVGNERTEEAVHVWVFDGRPLRGFVGEGDILEGVIGSNCFRAELGPVIWVNTTQAVFVAWALQLPHVTTEWRPITDYYNIRDLPGARPVYFLVPIKWALMPTRAVLGRALIAVTGQPLPLVLSGAYRAMKHVI